MEYCTEIAILQSAFQLVSKKAGKTLPLLPKENCKDLVTIIWTSVEEICKGIQYDLDVKEQLLWQQKLHSVLLYVLVKNKYREKEEPVREGRVPVLGALDMFTGILPTYSSSFYFELMKCCDWTENFLQSLQCLDYKTSSSLLNDLLQHCHSSPVTLEDGKVIAMVKDTLLSRCLCVPDYPSQLCAKLFEPLTQARKYVQTVYPEDEAETFVTMGTQNAAPIDNVNSNSCAGISFWNTFVEENPQILDMVMAYYENSLDGHLKKLPSQELLEVLSQLAVYLYFTTIEPKSDFTDKWFINNLFVQDYCKNMKGDSLDIVYSLNFTLIPHVHNNLSRSQLNVCLWKALNVFSRSGKVEHLTSKEPHIVHIVSGLSVNLVVLLRMLAGLLNNSEAVVVKYGVSGSLLTGNRDLMSWIQRCATSIAGTCTTNQGLVLGEAWTDDVTMDSLLWRIDHNLPQYQVCVDRLLDLTNIKFWTTDRLYTSMMKHPVLLGRVDRVLKLSQILDMIKGGNNLPIASTLLDLLIVSFPELSFPDQDTVVMEIYCRGDNSVKEFFKDGLTSKVTNVFNKVTADMDSQVLREIILLCLGDPLLVLSTAVSLCVRNEQQARNCALIMHHVQKTCKRRHPENHPETSLLVVLLSEFLNTQSLTEKEQKCFVIFISELMMPGDRFSNKDSTLSPSEFLQTIVLPCISVENFLSPYLMTCKFAVELLLIALDAGCKKKCDWSEYEFEPMALVLSLAEIQHECMILWEIADVLPNDSGETELKEIVAMETKAAKLPLREKVNQCMERICQMISKKSLTVSLKECYWLLEASRDLHWTVRLTLSSIYTACQLDQVKDDWLSTLNDLLEDPGSNLVTILQFVAVKEEYVQTVLNNLTLDTDISCEEIIHALIQVLPQCLSSEFERVVRLVEGLFGIETLNVSLMYRLQSTINLPHLHLSELESSLFTSQLLGDVILTLVMTLTPGDDSRSLLHHVIQCYVSVMKKQCDKIVKNQELQLLYLGELFHHVCQITLHLPAEIMDSSLVFLLHIVNKFKDVSKGMTKGQKAKVKSRKIGSKMVNYLENGMRSAIHRLPNSCEERHMLLKKLGNQS